MAKMQKTLSRFRRDERGVVAIMFGLSLIPMIGLTAAAVDYSRASQMRNRMATAADAAVLAAVKAGAANMTQRSALANAAFAANLGVDPRLLNISGNLTKLTGNAYRYEASADYKYTILQVLSPSSPTARLAVISEANAGDGKVEVALVLDNTGSMVNDMSSLRKAATDFTNTLFDMANGGTDLKMSVVPYVASVNPGRMNLGMSSIDARGDGEHHARNLRWRWIGSFRTATTIRSGSLAAGAAAAGAGLAPARPAMVPGCKTSGASSRPSAPS